VKAGLRYHRPAHFDDELTLEIAVARLGTTSITTNYYSGGSSKPHRSSRAQPCPDRPNGPSLAWDG